MTIIEQIKAEIDKRYAEYNEKKKTDGFTYYEGMADALDLFEQFIDTLESEKPMQEELDEEIAGMYRALFGTDIINCKEMLYLDTFEAIARHFAQWGAEHAREQMMKEAAEYEVWDFSVGAYPHVNIPLDNKQYRNGDKVRVIVCKKED